MNAPALPAYLQNRTRSNVAARAAQHLGAALPPHISIQGNTFTLIDASNNEQNAGPILDVCVVDVSDVKCKRFYPPDKPWTPDSNDAPACFSANGIGPSRDAAVPQARTCDECKWNVRGSATSKISGAAIKACRDEEWIAVYAPQFPGMLFQLVVTPGSFQNWRDYLNKFKQGDIDVSDVLTRMTFEPKVTGVLQFQATTFIDEATANVREQALSTKATETLVGRTDVPRGGEALPPAQQAGVLTGPAQNAQGALPQPAALPFVPAAAPAAPASPPAAFMTPAEAPAAAPAAEQPRTRRRRNTAQPEAAAAPQGAPMAPFRPEAAAPAPQAAQPSSFGIQGGVAPSPELESTLNSIFGPG